MAKPKKARKGKGRVRHRLPSLTAKTEKHRKPKHKRTSAQKLKAKKARLARERKMSAQDKKFAKGRSKVTAARRAKKIGTKASVKAGAAAARKAPKTAVRVEPAKGGKKTGKGSRGPMPLKHFETIKAGGQSIKIGFARGPSKSYNPIGEVHRHKKIIDRLKEAQEKMKTPASKAAIQRAIDKHTKAKSAHGHKIAAFIKNARERKARDAGGGKPITPAVRAKVFGSNKPNTAGKGKPKIFGSKKVNASGKGKAKVFGGNKPNMTAIPTQKGKLDRATESVIRSEASKMRREKARVKGKPKRANRRLSRTARKAASASMRARATLAIAQGR